MPLQTRRLDTYRREIRVIRGQRDELSSVERSSIREVVSLWKSLREVREGQNASHNTNIKIVIRKVTKTLAHRATMRHYN